MLYDGIILFGLLVIASALALPFGDTSKIAFQHFWFTVWLTLVCFAYLGGCWHYAGMTVGMRAWRVRLVSDKEKSISWSRCLLRFVTGIISLGLFGTGVLWAVIDKKKRCWHDLAGHTLLLKSVSEK